MATIALYVGKTNLMSGLIGDMRKSVTNFRSELSDMRTKALKVNKSICNLEDVIGTIQASTQTQDEKIASIETIQRDSEQFVADAVRIDCDVADLVSQRKDDFYGKYSYLKPNAEKSGWEKFCDGCEKAWEWCGEHWAMVVTVLAVVAIAVIAVVTFGVAVAAVAAIAGVVSLVLCVADTICVIATGGRELAAVFREKGWDVLADIFQGLQIGCDVVSILLPMILKDMEEEDAEKAGSRFVPYAIQISREGECALVFGDTEECRDFSHETGFALFLVPRLFL